MSIFWLSFEDFIVIDKRIVATEGLRVPIHPLTYYESDGILYLYRAFDNVIYGCKLSLDTIEKNFDSIDAFHTEHLSKAIRLVRDY